MNVRLTAAPIDRVLLAGIVVLTLDLCWTIADTIRIPNVQVGDVSPRFSLMTEGGRRVSSSDFGGKVLLLNFWATWCQTCLEEMPSLNQLAMAGRPYGIVVVAVSVDRDRSNYAQFLSRHPMTLLTAWDPSAELSSSFGTFRWPETYVIDRMAHVRGKYISNQDWLSPDILQSIRETLGPD
jgi:cytochrome c biogenesis protein CcmG/thiol:disulfide interchange protein DsbE